MRVHYLQHVHFEGLGYIETWLQENGHVLSATRFYEPGYQLPAIDEIDALIVMGGPMGVYDEHKYSWLSEEKRFIKACISAGKKVLGICLGAQLIAAGLGAQVHAAPNREIGWFGVQPTEDSRQLPWFYALFSDNPVVFHWHGDQFEIPEGSIDLLTSRANGNQAFYYNEHVMGLQFHLEVTGQSLAQMLQEGAPELDGSRYVQTTDEINAGKPLLASCNEMMAEVLAHWLPAKA